MQTILTGRAAASAAAIALVVALAVAVPTAQRRRADNSVHGAPVATNTIARTPDRYYGKLITVSAAVDQMLSTTVFVVDQRRATGAKEAAAIGTPLLVIAPGLTGALEENRYFLVRGEVVEFSVAALAQAASGYTPDVPQELLTKYEGQPVLIATSVLDGKYAERAAPSGAPAPPLAKPSVGAQ